MTTGRHAANTRKRAVVAKAFAVVADLGERMRCVPSGKCDVPVGRARRTGETAQRAASHPRYIRRHASRAPTGIVVRDQRSRTTAVVSESFLVRRAAQAASITVAELLVDRLVSHQQRPAPPVGYCAVRRSMRVIGLSQ